MRKILFASLVLAAFGTACDDKGRDSGESGIVESDAPLPPTEIQSATYNCDEVDYWYDVYVQGWTGSATLYIAQTRDTPPWDELGHDFWATESFDDAPDDDTRGYFDPNGQWDNPYLSLTRVDSTSAVVAGETTLYQCNADRESGLTWAVEVTDTSGAFADCATWGHNTSDTRDYDFSACRAI